MQRRKNDLDHRPCHQENDKTVYQHSSAVLVGLRHFQRIEHQVQDPPAVHQHIEIEALFPRVMVFCVHGKYKTAGERPRRQDQEIQDLQSCRCL